MEVPEDATGTVNIAVGGNEYSANVTDGKAVFALPLLDCDKYTVSATYSGDDKYENGTNQSGFKVVIIIEDYDMNTDASSNESKIAVNVDLPEDATGNVTITDMNGNNYTVPVENGKASVTIDAPVGENNLTVTYPGDKKYASKTSSVSVVNTKKSTVISGDKLEMYVGDKSKFEVKLTDKDGNLLSGKAVKITIAGKTYTVVSDKNGVASLPIGLKAGSYPVNVTFNGDSQYEASNILSTSVEVYTKVRLDQNKNLVKDYHDDSKPFTVRALDKYGKPAANQFVKMTVSGKTYTLKTNAKGIATLPINLYPGTYKITSEYEGYKVSNTITVKNVIYTTNRQWNAGSAFSYFTATLKHSDGKVLVGKTVSFTVAGKTYKAVTNAKGQATVTLKGLGAGKYTMQVKYIQYFIKKSITVK